MLSLTLAGRSDVCRCVFVCVFRFHILRRFGPLSLRVLCSREFHAVRRESPSREFAARIAATSADSLFLAACRRRVRARPLLVDHYS